MNNKGWVRTWREQFSHEISEQKPWCDGYAWTFLYSAANHKDGIANFRNQYIPVTRGQLLTSKLKLQAIFGWSRRRLDSFLKTLEIREMCVISTTNRFIIITIQNYDIYQPIANENEQTDLLTDGRTGDKQVTTIKEINKNININTREVLSYLNQKTGKQYRNAKHIEARLNDGRTIEDCKRVIDTKIIDPYFIANSKYLNPETLFRPSNFDRYLNEANSSLPAVKENAAESISICPRCHAQIPPSDRFGEGCINCESLENLT